MAPIVTEEYKNRKKQEILRSALKCFAKKGFQQATMDDIVEDSGLSKGAIYNYFKSKDEIYLELMKSNTEETERRLKEKLEKLATAKEKLAFVFELYESNSPFESPGREMFLVHYEFRLHAQRDEKLEQLLKERKEGFFIRIVLDILNRGQINGEFKQEFDPLTMANVFWGMIDGASVSSIVDQEYPYKKAVGTMKEMFLSYLN